MKEIYRIIDEMNKQVLWDNIDGESILENFQRIIDNEEINVLEIDLKEVLSIDKSFIINVILFLLKDIVTNFHGSKGLIISNTNNEDVLLSISLVLEDKGKFILHKSGESFKVIGKNSIKRGKISKQLMHQESFNLSELSSTSNIESSDLMDFIELGYLEQIDNDNYRSRLVEW